MSILRLILGDQLNREHTWYQDDKNCLYVLMEIRQETDYVRHHIQKIVCFFAAMRSFADELLKAHKSVLYIKIDDPNNTQSLYENLLKVIEARKIQKFEYLRPDEYRLDNQLNDFCTHLKIASQVFDTEHFYTSREELGEIFKGKKQFLMETFYRKMRQKHQIMMPNNQPEGGAWNFDKLNRQKYDNKVPVPMPIDFKNDLSYLKEPIEACGADYFGDINWQQVIWPINRTQALQALDFFIKKCLPHFGTYEDALSTQHWSLFHSRLSFALNIKLISPKEVVDKSVAYFYRHPELVSVQQIEGFVRQILGWREYMRGIYWLKMPSYQTLNFFNNQKALPSWFWTGQTKMNCLKQSISASLKNAYAHHIQRLMIMGNFAALAGIDPDEVDTWYLGIYIDALDWVEITNTRGMSQYADGGIVGSKPYVSSANYIDKMSDYCGKCYYKKSEKLGEKACPFNSLYWHFHHRNRAKLNKNPRIGMVYVTWNKTSEADKALILAQADSHLANLENL